MYDFRFSVLFYGVIILSPAPTQYVSYSYGRIKPVCAESAVNQPTDFHYRQLVAALLIASLVPEFW